MSGNAVIAPLSPRAVELLEQARRWRLIGLLFERPHGTWWVELGVLREECPEPRGRLSVRVLVRGWRH